MPQTSSISPTTVTSSSSSSSTASSSPTSLAFPSPGDIFRTREELSTIIKGNGKAIGYIFKCSVTSEHKVTYYCSNKYHSPRCMAGFKAAHVVGDGWYVTEATEHNEGCTRARQRVNGVKPCPSITSGSYKPTPPVACKKKQPSKPSHVTVTVSQAQIDKTRKSATSLKAANPSAVSYPTVTSGSTPAVPAKDAKDLTAIDAALASTAARKHRSYSSSTGATSPLAAVIMASRRGSLTYGSRRSLREVDENEALEASEEDDEAQASLRSSTTAPRNGRSTKNSKKAAAAQEDSENGGRDRSSSSVSSQSTRSERSQITTILDPAFHFPPASVEACEIQKALPCRRKRSASYIKSTATSSVLLGRYLENQKMAQEDIAER